MDSSSSLYLNTHLQDIQVYIQANVPRLSLPKVFSQNVINPIELLTNHQENLYMFVIPTISFLIL